MVRLVMARILVIVTLSVIGAVTISTVSTTVAAPTITSVRLSIAVEATMRVNVGRWPVQYELSTGSRESVQQASNDCNQSHQGGQKVNGFVDDHCSTLMLQGEKHVCLFNRMSFTR